MDESQALTGCHTERGRRPVNQDAVLAVRLADGRELVAVADGMGGHSAGEVASQCALETLWAQLKAGVSLRAAVTAANAAVHAEAAGNPAWGGMGTTLVAMLRSGSSYEIANVGDSRAYHVTAEAVRQITTDHSFAAEAMREARMGSDEIVQSRWRNALTRALGTDRDVEVDCYGPFDARESHAVLLCSDGLYRSVSDDVLRQHIGGVADAWAAARSVTAEAFRNGSCDNISAAVVILGVREERVAAPSTTWDGRRVEGQPPSAREGQRAEVQSRDAREERGAEAESSAARAEHVQPAAPSEDDRTGTPRRSHRRRRADIQLAVTVMLLIVVVTVLMRVL